MWSWQRRSMLCWRRSGPCKGCESRFPPYGPPHAAAADALGAAGGQACQSIYLEHVLGPDSRGAAQVCVHGRGAVLAPRGAHCRCRERTRAYAPQNLAQCTPAGWCLKMEGRLMDLGVRARAVARPRFASPLRCPAQRGGTRFTDMFNRVVIRLDSDVYPDTPLIEVRRGRRGNRRCPPHTHTHLSAPTLAVAARLGDAPRRRPRVCGVGRRPMHCHHRISRRLQSAAADASRPTAGAAGR